MVYNIQHGFLALKALFLLADFYTSLFILPRKEEFKIQKRR